jgi:hypothetical protein
MDKHGAAVSHDAIPIREVDPPYAGQPGQTRFESVHLVNPDGSLRTWSVCRTVNTKTHPELKLRALSGLLHRLDDGRELALSFVYHDPDARKLALVLPAVLAHTELKEWSRLMAEVAEDTRHPVPRYVRDATTVVGAAALEQYALAPGEAPDAETIAADGNGADRPDGADGTDDSAQERLLLQRERELAEQERALIRMAEGLTSREGDLNRLQDQLDTARVDLELREAEMADHRQPAARADRESRSRADRESRSRTDRESRSRDADRELRSRDSGAARNSGSWTEVGVAQSTDDEATVVGEAPHDAFVANDGSGMVGGGRSHPPPLPLRVSRTGPPPLPWRTRASPPPLSPRRDPEDARRVIGRASEPPPLPKHTASAPLDKDPEPEVLPPAYFAGQRVGQMAIKLIADELWLFVHIEEERAAAFRRGIDLMLQYVEIEDYPVLVLSLVSQSQEPHAIRLALDGHSESDLRVLEHLSRSFRARVALYIGGLYCETLTVATLREGVAQAMADKLVQLPKERTLLSSADAMVRVLHAPPPLWNDDLPFGPARREASTTAAVLAAVEQLTSWLRPEKLAEATLTYCVPRNVIEATIRRVLRAAVVFGIALTDELLKLAVEHRASSDEQSLVRDQIQAFKQRIEQGENDLGSSATRSNWDKLFLLAEAREVVIDDTTRALASAELPPSVRPDATRAQRPLEALPAADLKARLLIEADRLEAIRELCVRGHVSSIELVLSVLDQVPVTELPRAIAYLLLFGEAAGDGLIAALSGDHPSLRQMAALALGRLKLRRALLPLLQQLEAEETAIHAELARAFGDFGPASLRMVVRAIPGATRPDRLVLALAHLANHGSAKDVEKLENDPDSNIAHVARKAMARRSRMEWEDLAVRGQRTLGDSDPAALLSQAFYAEVVKVAI